MIKFILPNDQRVGLKGLYKGAVVFLVCGGPSFNDLDSTLLCEPGVLSMGINNAPKTFRPNLWIHGDPAHKFMRSIFFDKSIIKFSPYIRRDDKIFDSDAWAWTDKRVKDCGPVFFYPLAHGFDSKTWAGRDDVVWGDKGSNIRSTMLAALKILLELGAAKVFLLGADADGKAYHFEQKWSRSNTAAYPVLDARFKELKPELEVSGMSVFNCNPYSHFKAFDYMPYLDAIDEAKVALGANVADERSVGLYDEPKPVI